MTWKDWYYGYLYLLFELKKCLSLPDIFYLICWFFHIQLSDEELTMAVPFSNTKLRVPRGFQNLLEGLAREVLRSQPADIYAFAAVYFENMVKSTKSKF